MAITEDFATVADPSIVPAKRSRWGSAETYVLVIGFAAVAVLAIGRLLYEPSMQEKDEAARAAMAPEHMQVCDKLGKTTGPDRDGCLKLLDDLYTTHARAFVADNSEI
jgi:hypothetical protein